VVSSWVDDECIELMAGTDIDTARGSGGADLGEGSVIRLSGQDNSGEWYRVSPVQTDIMDS
jgi:hypothetical protein